MMHHTCDDKIDKCLAVCDNAFGIFSVNIPAWWLPKGVNMNEAQAKRRVLGCVSLG